MNKQTKIFGALALGLAGLGTAGYAASATMDNDDDAVEAAAFADAKISLVDAVALAEQSTNALAAEAEFESEDGKAVFEVGLYDASGAELEAIVDATTGELIRAGPDDGDDESGEGAD